MQVKKDSYHKKRSWILFAAAVYEARETNTHNDRMLKCPVTSSGHYHAVRLHHRAAKKNAKFPGPLIWPAPSAVNASHTHTPSLTDLHLPLERVEGTCTPTPFSKGGGYNTKCSPCLLTPIIMIVRFCTICKKAKPCAQKAVSRQVAINPLPLPQCSPVLLTRVSYKST